MEPVTLAAAVAGTILATIGLDVAMNMAQDYYHILYVDAFWEESGRNPDVEARLTAEEQTIDRLFRRTDFGASGALPQPGQVDAGLAGVMSADPTAGHVKAKAP